MAADEAQRRAHFRLRYPDDARPLLCTEQGDFPICEISEGGLRIVLQAPEARLPERLQGLIELGQERLAIEGRVLRRMGEELVLVLSQGVPLAVMLNEQRRLLRLYPRLFGRD